jgi:hypothetical protein
MLMMTVLMLLGSAFLTVSLTERTIAANEVAVVRSFHLAEAGLEHALKELEAADVDALLASEDALLDEQSLGLGTYGVTVRNNVGSDFPLGSVPADSGGAAHDADGYLVVTSTGRYRDAVRTIVAVVARAESSSEEGRWSLFGDYYVSAHGAGDIVGTLGSNGDIVLSAHVVGDVSAGGTVNNPGLVSGTVTTGVPRVKLLVPHCPEVPFGPLPLGPGIAFDSFTGNITLSGSGDKWFPAGTYFFGNFVKVGSGKMRVAVGDNVQIYVKHGLSLRDVGFDNENEDAGFVRLRGCGDNPAELIAAPEWSFRSTNRQWITVYSPNHPLRLLGVGDIVGSVVGKSAFKFSSGDVIYDEALAEAPSVAGYAVVPGTWQER